MEAQQAYAARVLRPALAIGNEVVLVMRDLDSNTSQDVTDHTPEAAADEKNVATDLQRFAAALQTVRKLALDDRMVRDLDAVEKFTYGADGFVTVEQRALHARIEGDYGVANQLMVHADLAPAHKALVDYIADVRRTAPTPANSIAARRATS